ncbi:MAG TPA: hypothetical protein VM689_04095 [Aliidongia sp.]|nr:hypothetical protein [Aliidongia sp.]
MATIFVARSAGLSDWASDVGLSKHVYKLGVTEAPIKEVVAAGWSGFTDWKLLKQQDVEGVDDADIVARLAARVKMIDPNLYPRLKDEAGMFKVLPAQVENHITLTRALAGNQDSGELKVKPVDFANFLIHNALR